MIHEGHLKESLQRDSHISLLQAIRLSSLRRLGPEASHMNLEVFQNTMSDLTMAVTMTAISTMSVHNAQTLIIIAFEDMLLGNWSRASSLLGSLVKMLECLGLLTDEDEAQPNELVHSLKHLAASNSVVQREERNRVFWNVFLLDRLCSVACGCQTWLTQGNVRRRLPCNGALWRSRRSANTPFFGIWKKSQGQLGCSVAHPPSLSTTSPTNDGSAGSTTRTQEIDVSDLGAVSYHIEATESLSQITSYFLYQHVDFTKPSDVRNWLTRFTELDLRLIHWKLFLPKPWQDSHALRPETGRMDPNLTLAHMIHNTSTILLHQQIAYPYQALRDSVNLPSSTSADTCGAAARAVLSIAAKYSACSKDMPVNTEFVFCVFVASIVLLVHAHCFQAELDPGWDVALDTLTELSSRFDVAYTTKAKSIGDDATDSSVVLRSIRKMREYRAWLQGQAPGAAHALLRYTAQVLLYGNLELESIYESSSKDEAETFGMSPNPAPSSDSRLDTTAMAASAKNTKKTAGAVDDTTMSLLGRHQDPDNNNSQQQFTTTIHNNNSLAGR